MSYYGRHGYKHCWWKILRILGFDGYSWDKQYEAGIWCRRPRSVHTLEKAAALCAGGRLVEFGCGEGNLPFLLPPGSYSEYQGYDISRVAIEHARERAAGKGAENIRFAQCDMRKWSGAESASLILVEETLYYLPPNEIVKFLLRCSTCLATPGFILVIVHSVSKHAATLGICRRTCRVVDEQVIDNRGYLTLTCK